MGTMEYRLRNAAEQLSEHDRELFRNNVDSLFNQLSSSTNSEAVLIGRLIYLPAEEVIQYPSNIKINPVKKTKIDYISMLQNNELIDSLKKLQKKYDLGQGELNRITRKVKKLQKSFAEEQNSIEKLIKLMEEYTEQVVNDKQVEKYVKDIENYCDKLKNCLLIENPEILTEEKKKEVINKIDVLQSYMDDFRRSMEV